MARQKEEKTVHNEDHLKYQERKGWGNRTISLFFFLINKIDTTGNSGKERKFVGKMVVHILGVLSLRCLQKTKQSCLGSG